MVDLERILLSGYTAKYENRYTPPDLQTLWAFMVSEGARGADLSQVQKPVLGQSTEMMLGYGPYWKTARLWALFRASNRCERCGREWQQLHVHHKQPFIAFMDKSEAHNGANLIVLCESCHAKAHNPGSRTQFCT